MKEVIEQIVPSNYELIKYGQVDEKLLLELRMTTSLYEYIHVITNYYDDDEYMPYKNNWTDVEGMGYGWRWMRYEEKDWHKMMSKMVSEEADSLIKEMENTLYFVYENEEVKTYHFITLDGGSFRTDIIIDFSNSELDF